MVFQLLKQSALELVVLTFIIALGAVLLGTSSGLGKSLTLNSLEYNISVAGNNALKTYSDYFGIIVIAIVFVAIIGVIMIVGGAASGGRV
jgi:hypothetical protein